MAQARSGGEGRPPGTGTGSDGGNRKPPAAASPSRDRVTEQSGDGTPTGDNTVEVAKSSGDGSVASHKPDVPVSEKTKDGQKVTTTRDDRPANPQVHAPGDRQARNSGDQPAPPRGDGQASPQITPADARPPASDNGMAGPPRPAPRPVSGSGGTSNPPPAGGETAVLGAATPTMVSNGGGLQVGPSSATSSTTRSKKSSGSGRGPRQAHLVLRRIEPWSAMKFSFVVSLVCFVILFVAVAVLYGVLSGLGVFESLVTTINSITNADAGTPGSIDASSWFDPVRILGFTALIGAIDVVLITALSTLGAVIYNLASSVVGGVEVTLTEAE